MQAAASKLISICVSASNGRPEAADEIPAVLARLNELYSTGFNAKQDSQPMKPAPVSTQPKTADKAPEQPEIVNRPAITNQPMAVNRPTAAPAAPQRPVRTPESVPANTDWQSTMKKTLDDWDKFAKSPAGTPVVAKIAADEISKQNVEPPVSSVTFDAATPEETDGIAAEDTRPLSLRALAIAEQKRQAEQAKPEKKPVFKPVKVKGENLPAEPDKKNSGDLKKDEPKENSEKKALKGNGSDEDKPDNGNKHPKLKPAVKGLIAALFVIGLIGVSRLASSGANYTAASPTSTPEALETATPDPTETVVPVETSTPTPEPTKTPSATAKTEATADPDDPDATATPDAEDEEKETRKEPLGTAGRLYFDEGWSVALNYADSYDTKTAQTLADAWDSACYMEDSGKIMIADHATQGFDIILNCPEGTRATLVDADGNETRIICKSLYTDAYWEDGFTHLPDGRGIWGATDGSIGMQTSTNSDGTQVFISYWDPVEE